MISGTFLLKNVKCAGLAGLELDTGPKLIVVTANSYKKRTQNVGGAGSGGSQ